MEAEWNITNEADKWNDTEYDWESQPAWKKTLHTFQSVLLALILVVIMLGMGCNISLKLTWEHLKRPIGCVIGVVGQFVLLPLMAFGVATALSFEKEHAIGLLLLCTCPGGALSNIFTYWVDGDVSLSVSMTTVSTVVSFGMMPFNLWLYSRWWAVGGATIPYVKIVITLVTILVSVAVGLIIKRKSRKVANWITTIGTVSGLVAIVAATVIVMILFPFVFRVSWRLIVVGFLLPSLALMASYLVAFLCRREPRVCLTIGIETAIQNIPMVSSIITLSYAPEVAAKMLTPALLYGPIMTLEGMLFCGLYRLLRSVKENYQVNPKSEVDTKNKHQVIYSVDVNGKESQTSTGI